jgi:hypothetical protein
MSAERLYLTEGEVATLLARSLSSLRNDRSLRRGLPFIKLGKKSIRYDIRDIEKYLDSCRVKTTDR